MAASLAVCASALVLAAFTVARLGAAQANRPFMDRTHVSTVFGAERHYRIFLPPSYDTSDRRYPVIYYFHGHSDRYTLERYDDGKDTVPKIARFVGGHDVIVVSVDGYVAEDYTGFYGGSPWDVREDGGHHDFGVYFHELVEHIDTTYRTLAGRRHRGTSGLSMGGFMSLYLSARYPDLIGSASSFNPGPEFFTGDPGRRMLWRPKDHVRNHTHTMVRLIRASGDYISQYHEETREAYARALDVDFEFRQDEYHRHWATSIGETFDFHMRAFGRSDLDNIPETFDHANAYRNFDVWGYHVEAGGDDPGFTILEGVRQGGMRILTQRWAPDGPPVDGRRIHIVTGPIYESGSVYELIDYGISTGEMRRQAILADSNGRISFTVDGGGHQLSFAGPGTGSQPPVLLPVTSGGVPRVAPNQDVALPVRIYNPRGDEMSNVQVEVLSEYPAVNILEGTTVVAKIPSGTSVDLSDRLKARFTAGTGYFAPARLTVNLTFDGWYQASESVDVLIAPEGIPEPDGIEILDGRTTTFQVFRQKGNQGGGEPVERTVTEGRGNGNGVLDPGEEATIWVKMRQGMDPFDKNNWHRAKVYFDSPWVSEIEDIRELKQREWTGAQNRTSRILLSADVPKGAKIPLLLDRESWSFHFTPDVRYGTEKLYQAFQRHTNHLFRHTIEVP